MGEVAIACLGDLTPSYRLYGVCNACHRMDRLNLLALLARLGPGCRIASVRHRLRCRRCDSTDCGIRIVWAGCGG